jgi:phosphate transport system protein
MQRQFEVELDRIKEQVLTMAGLVEKSLDDTAKVLTDRDMALAHSVVGLDNEIDQCEVAIDRLATEFIVRQQPMATDLRFVIVAIKLGPELERIADNSVNICRYLIDIDSKEWMEPLPDLPRMLALARAMVSDAIASYVARDAGRARAVIERDDDVDELYWKVFRRMLDTMAENPETISQSISHILVARFAERIADQATNIGEEVVYLVEGQPIRHAGGDGGAAVEPGAPATEDDHGA